MKWLTDFFKKTILKRTLYSPEWLEGIIGYNIYVGYIGEDGEQGSESVCVGTITEIRKHKGKYRRAYFEKKYKMLPVDYVGYLPWDTWEVNDKKKTVEVLIKKIEG